MKRHFQTKLPFYQVIISTPTHSHHLGQSEITSHDKKANKTQDMTQTSYQKYHSCDLTGESTYALL